MGIKYETPEEIAAHDANHRRSPMNPETANERPVWHVGLGFLAASFLFAILVLAVKHSVRVPAIDADRAAERAKDLAESVRPNPSAESSRLD